MADDFPRDRPHLFIRAGEVEPYRRPKQGGGSPQPPYRDRAAHAAALEAAIGAAINAGRLQSAKRDPRLPVGSPGFYLEIEIPPGEGAVIDQLGNRTKQIEVVAVREPAPGGLIMASVFVPTRAEDYFLDKVRAYRDTNTKKGRPKNEPLIARMETVRLANARSLFTDADGLFPADANVQVWWEVWLRDGGREGCMRLAAALNVRLRPHVVRFPEREVLLALANVATLDRLVANGDVVAELRRAKDTPSFYMRLEGAEQRAWSEELLDRLTPPDLDAPVAVCLLDSGVRRTHPLIGPFLVAGEHLTINPVWGADDSSTRWQGHGTAMAGVAIFGGLTPVLAGPDPIAPPFRLESVRILPPDGEENQPDLYGAITAEAIARAEIAAPRRARVVICAVTASPAHRGRPTSWSAAVDQLCFGDPRPRLILVSAGNLEPDIVPSEYLTRNDVESVDDPAQAWNAVTIGAYTDKVDIIDPTLASWTVVAPAGELSPGSRTSVTWDRQWPIKPDVVFEGGNLGHDGRHPGVGIDDLQLLTTYYRPRNRHFTTLGDTSAATALAANMAGAILADRPRLWPETVRGLMVHSADWTPAMWSRITGAAGRKTQIARLFRRYGYGVPDLGRALRSARNDLTSLVEDDLRPFERDGSRPPKTRQMKLHRLPWPREELSALGAAQVELRVTLSYFVEPNPGERGWSRKHRYASHGLRFRVKLATESVQDFRARINEAAREEEAGAPPPIWPNVTRSGSFPSADGGRKNPIWTDSTRPLVMP